MIGPNISQGLNHRGAGLTQDLNHEVRAFVVVTALAIVAAEAYDPRAEQFLIEARGFRPDEDSYHKPDGATDGGQHTETGLDPQADPARASRLDDSSYHDEDGEEAGPQHVQTGLDPQADPVRAAELDNSSYHKPDSGPETPQTPQSGLEPQADPQTAYEPKESGSEDDEG